MSLFGKKEKAEIEQLNAEIKRLNAQLSPEQSQLLDLDRAIEGAKQRLAQLEAQILSSREQLDAANEELANTRQQIIETDEAVLMQSFGIYTPHYSYSTSDEYKSQLAAIRFQQKELIKSGCAVNGSNNWEVNGSASKGKRMVADMQKLLLRAYNAECDDAIEHVKFNNVAACEKKIIASAEAISKLGAMMAISITSSYLKLKLDELYLMHEYQLKKQAEKEAAKEARQRQREEAKAAKELEDARRKLEKEQSHYENALSRLNDQIAKATNDDSRNALLSKKAELEGQLSEIESELTDVDYRAANQRAGYVYIISNIGAFGENIYKIGMTRRLNPMDRVDELGDASVPFDFDVHALIFTDDAPGLEAALHNAFSDRKLNFVNQRREFFAVTLDEIKQVVRENYDKTVEFVDIPPAEQYRESLRLRSANV